MVHVGPEPPSQFRLSDTYSSISFLLLLLLLLEKHFAVPSVGQTGVRVELISISKGVVSTVYSGSGANGDEERE